MRKFLFFIPIVAGMLLLTACPYQSETSIDDGSYTDIAWLAGTWKADMGNAKYVISKGGSGNILAISYDTAGSAIDTYKIITSKIGKSTFLNVYEPGDDMTNEGFYIYRLDKISNTVFEILPMKENESGIESFNGSLAEFLAAKGGNDEVYDLTGRERYLKK